MSLSEEEKEKFMSMIDKDTLYYNGKRFIKNLSNVVYAEISLDEDRIKYFRFAYAKDTNLYPISVSCDKSNLDFIVSIINKASPNMRIVYSSDIYIVYSSERLENKSVKTLVFDWGNHHKAWLCFMNRSYPLFDYNAILCDDTLEQLCVNADNKHVLLKEYLSHPEAFSKEMRDKIKLIYDELSASEKLLLELGCDV